MDWLSIAISSIALLVSISSFQWNKAQHNLNQLQNNAKKFCDNMQEFIELGTEHCLSSFKFEMENICHIVDKERQSVAYNDLQLEFSKRKNICQENHKKVMESIEFLWIQGQVYNNALMKWLNKTLNEYYLKLSRFYGDLSDINFIVCASKKGLLTKERKEFVNAFFDNIRDLLDYNIVFIVLKKEIAGYFGRLSLVDVGLFGKTKSALIKIENDIMRFIEDFGLEEAISKKDYTKIRKCCLNCGEKFDSFVKEEQANFLQFLRAEKYTDAEQ